MENFEALLYEFFGGSEVLTLNQVRKLVRRVGVDEGEVAGVVELLCDAGFLGLETRPNEFTFTYDEGRKKAALAGARRTEEILKVQRFAVNIPYHAFLEIESGIPSLSPVKKDVPPRSRSKAGRRR